jgi:sugar/nucleoside kinase (ribokinase family)
MMGMRMMMTGTASTKSPTTTNSAVRGGRGTREPAAVVFRSEDGSAEDRCSVNRAFMRPLCGLYALTAVDGTVAGDAFCAARACAAGAIAASRPGAQRSLPTAAELEEILAR